MIASPYNVIFCWLESCLARSLQAHLLRQQQSRVYPILILLNRISSFLRRDILLRIYKPAVVPLLDYGCVVMGWMQQGERPMPRTPTNRAMRIILHADLKTCTQKMRAKLFLLSLYSRRVFSKLQYAYKTVYNINCPKQLIGYIVKRSQRHCRSLRDPTLSDSPPVKTKCGQTSFKFSAASAWNKLRREIRELRTLAQFKIRTFIYLMNMDRANHFCKSNT